MTTTESRPTADEQPVPEPDGTLAAFTGNFVPGVCFESGHCFWLLEFTSTPTQFDSYTELWIITPEGKRVLYTDPEAATDEVLKYHDFDRTEGASVTCDAANGRIGVRMEATDGTDFELTASAGQTLRTRLLNGVITLTPSVILQSPIGTRVSTVSLNRLLDANGLKVAGRTETDRRYRLDAERMERITTASATLDGRDLGALEPPSRPIEFGDVKTTADALYVPGTVQLERFDQ
ncbi:MAG: hypothetical protein V5A52_06390 [Halovenus sp.]